MKRVDDALRDTTVDEKVLPETAFGKAERFLLRMQCTPSLTVGLLPRTSARIAGNFNVAPVLRNFNSIQLQCIGDFLSTCPADRGRRVLTADNYRGYEERDLVHQAGIKHQSGEGRSTFDQNA